MMECQAIFLVLSESVWSANRVENGELPAQPRRFRQVHGQDKSLEEAHDSHHKHKPGKIWLILLGDKNACASTANTLAYFEWTPQFLQGPEGAHCGGEYHKAGPGAGLSGTSWEFGDYDRLH